MSNESTYTGTVQSVEYKGTTRNGNSRYTVTLYSEELGVQVITDTTAPDSHAGLVAAGTREGDRVTITVGKRGITALENHAERFNH